MVKLNEIKVGSHVHVHVVKTPRRSAAAKTLVRLLSKDVEVKHNDRRLRKVRRSGLRLKQRGGRRWAVRMVKQRSVVGQAGESGTIAATVDVLADLASVAGFVQVSNA